MVNWTNIPTDRIEPGKPIRAIDGLALRDNPIAIAEGAPGAPRIQGAALDNVSIPLWLGGRPVGAVGTIAMARTIPGISKYFGDSMSGSELVTMSVDDPTGGGSSLSGAWRVLGSRMANTSEGIAYTIVLRII